MKVIFLDIDGVMNSEEHALELRAKAQAKEITQEEYHDSWDLPYDKTLLALQKIIVNTNAKVVLSSTWRLNSDRIILLNKIFKSYGFQIIDRTCKNVTKEELEKCGFKMENTYDAELNKKYGNELDTQFGLSITSDRGAEIAWWLYEHPETTDFVILDDDSADIDNYYKDKHVKTIFKTGLTDKDADKAITILNTNN